MNFIVNFLRNGSNDKIYSDFVRKAVIINVFALVGIMTMLVYFVRGLALKQYFYSFVMGVLITITIISLIVFHFTNKINFFNHVLLFIQLTLNLSLLYLVGENYSVVLWIYLIPLLSAFLVNRHWCIIYSSFQLIVLLIGQKTGTLVHLIPDLLLFRAVSVYVVISVLTYTFEYIRERTMLALQQAFNEIAAYNEEVLMQKEEILAQAELLEQRNQQLQQLSIVASETDNAVLIADSNGLIQYVNAAFEKIYGFSLQYLKEKSRNVFDYIPDAQEIKEKLINRQTVSFVDNVYGNVSRWVQVDVSPYFVEDKLEKIILVATDITQLKLYEQKILEQNEELRQQSEEILAQKEELEAKNEIILAKNQAIEQSLSYASMIQKALLPDLSILSQKFKNFLIYLPKDIVSGDFYWHLSENSYDFFAVVDCTGHGVPAAFLTIVCSRLLTEIVSVAKIYEPAKILKELSSKFYQLFSLSQGERYEGADLILVRLNYIGNVAQLIISGAKRPFIYYDSADRKIKRLPNFKGLVSANKFYDDFQTSELLLAKESVIYLFSDGLLDQHNVNAQKFGTTRFIELLEKIKDYDLKDQRESIVKEALEWKGNFLQVDDITIWGVKI